MTKSQYLDGKTGPSTIAKPSTPVMALALAASLTLLAPAGAAAQESITVLGMLPVGQSGYIPGFPCATKGVIADSKRNLYGTLWCNFTADGTKNSYGLAYEIDASGNYTILHQFAGSPDGANSYGPLVRDAKGDLFGTTVQGGATGLGTVFELTPPRKGQSQWAYQVIYNFCQNAGDSCTDGTAPYGGLILDGAGNLYGTTSSGGAPNAGTVFELAPPTPGNTAWTETLLYSFCQNGGGHCTDGGTPLSSVVFHNGALFGTTRNGGAHVLNSCSGSQPYGNGCLNAGGTIFELTQSGSQWSEQVLYSFCAQKNCQDGTNPTTPLVFDSSGALYGTTSGGGSKTSSGGVVYQLAPSAGGWSFSDIHFFCWQGSTCNDGITPWAGVTLGPSTANDVTVLYGTTAASVFGGNDGFGAVYRLSENRSGHWGEKILSNDFAGRCPTETTTCTVLSNPNAGSLALAGDSLYGVTIGGYENGVHYIGGVYQLDR